MDKSNTHRSQSIDEILFHHFCMQNRIIVQEFISHPKDSPHDRLLGCMGGLAVGDVLGCPVEGMNPQRIYGTYKKIDRLIRPGISRYWRFPGLHSDDTQQALVLLGAIRQSKKESKKDDYFSSPFSKEHLRDIAGHVARMYIKGIEGISGKHFQHAFGCWRGTGKGFRNVVKSLAGDQDKFPSWAFGKGIHSAGLGAVMRIPPLGVLPGLDKAELLQLVVAISVITHTDVTALFCAYVIAISCRILSESSHETFSSNSFFNKLFKEIQTLEQDLRQNELVKEYCQKSDDISLTLRLLKLFPELLKSNDKNAMSDICDTAAHDGWHRFELATSGYAPTGLVASLFFFAKYAKEPEKCVFASINAGGDTDTIAAIVGALCGSLHGTGAYEKYLPNLTALKLIENTVLSTLAAPSDNSFDIFDIIEYETSLTEIEALCRQQLLQ